MGGEEVSAVRARISEGHVFVSTGKYREAAACFRGALPELTALLGESHPEVEELRDDIETVHAMAGVADFGATMGFRWNDKSGGGPG